MALQLGFEIDVCLITLDAQNPNGGNSDYVREATADWSFNENGAVTKVQASPVGPFGSANYGAAAGSGVIAPNGWTAVTDGSEPTTTGQSFNQMLKTETF
jgi:hypothetical protein